MCMNPFMISNEGTIVTASVCLLHWNVDHLAQASDKKSTTGEEKAV